MEKISSALLPNQISPESEVFLSDALSTSADARGVLMATVSMQQCAEGQELLALPWGSRSEHLVKIQQDPLPSPAGRSLRHLW